MQVFLCWMTHRKKQGLELLKKEPAPWEHRVKVKDQLCKTDFLFDVNNLKEMDGVRANVSSSNDYVTLGPYRKVTV